MAFQTPPLIDATIASEEVKRRIASAARAGVGRFEAIDLLRGIVMVIMMLDHTRDFAHNYSLRFDPTDLTHTTPAIFFTRWITHFCAPVFVFLAGASAYLQRMRGKRLPVLSRFLLIRGLWLVLLEFTVVRFGIGFDLSPSTLGIAQVIWVIGISMIVLAVLVWLPTVIVAVIGIVMIVAHNAFDATHVEPWLGPASPVPPMLDKLWIVLHQPGVIPVGGAGSPLVFLAYPLIPWIGVMAAGYAFGTLYLRSPAMRYRRIAQIGMLLTGAFLVLRAINNYGDPQPWLELQIPEISVLSFFNVTKYPPSLLYLCMTLGPALLFLAYLERRGARPGPTSPPNVVERTLTMFGRVPLFFYILQWYVAHLLVLVVARAAGQDVDWLFHLPGFASSNAPQGFSLPVVYLLWATGVLLLYFPCRWYARLKATKRYWWLSYL